MSRCNSSETIRLVSVWIPNPIGKNYALILSLLSKGNNQLALWTPNYHRHWFPRGTNELLSLGRILGLLLDYLFGCGPPATSKALGVFRNAGSCERGRGAECQGAWQAPASTPALATLTAENLNHRLSMLFYLHVLWQGEAQEPPTKGNASCLSSAFSSPQGTYRWLWKRTPYNGIWLKRISLSFRLEWRVLLLWWGFEPATLCSAKPVLAPSPPPHARSVLQGEIIHVLIPWI